MLVHRLQSYWFLLLVGLVLLTGVAEIWLVGSHTSWAAMQASAPDEVYFIESARHAGFAQFGFGYGPAFWAPLVFIVKLVPAQFVVIVASIIFVSIKYAAIGVVAMSLWRANKQIASACFVIAIVASPGYFFLGKIISPEYLLLLFTGLAIKELLEDSGELGRAYLKALFYVALASLTKLSALPWLGLLIGYGFVFGYLDARRGIGRPYLERVTQIIILLTSVMVGLILVTWPRNILADIHAALAVVPPWMFSFDVLKTAWNFDSVTWDQIKLGGIEKDFLPTFALGVLALVMMIGVRPARSKRPIWVIYLAALAIMFATVFHGSGHTWYLFMPMFMFAAVGVVVMAEFNQSVQLGVLIVIVVIALVGIQRMRERIDFKLANNHEMSIAGVEAQQLVDEAQGKYPCVRSANFDILIPWKQERGDFLPLRLALENKVSGKYEVPDMLLVNNKLPSKDHSPLLDYVVKGDISQFELFDSSVDVSLYINKSLKCGVN